MPLYTVLPRRNDPNASDASAMLRGVIAEPVNVVMVILGRPKKVEKVLEVAIGRAESQPNIRRVVHVPDPEVLEPKLRDELLDGGKPVAVLYGLADRVETRLRLNQALSKWEVEDAFGAAEKQTGE